MILKIISEQFFSNYIFHPSAKELSPKDQRKALISSIFLGIFTLGICHLVCLIKYRNRTFKLAEIGNPDTQKDQTIAALHVNDIKKTKATQNTNVCRLDQRAIKLDTFPKVNLWLRLEQKTQAKLQALEFLSKDHVNHRFSNIRCPSKTAVSIAGQYLHANKVGEGLAQRAFVASQAPLLEDYETFWKDFGTVSLSALHALVQKVEALATNTKDLIWIHCRAGVGRTGTLITALTLKEKIERGEINTENLVASLEDIIIEFRKQRGSAFVQLEDQLDLIFQYARFLIELKESPST